MSDIAIGEPLPWDVYGTDRKLLLRKGHIIRNEHQIETLVARGLYVTEGAGGQQKRPDPARVQELPSVLRLVNAATRRLEKLLYSFGSEPEFETRIIEIVGVLQTAVDLQPDIALGCILLNQDISNYAVRHGVDTAIVVRAVMRAMPKSPEEIQATMAAALTMNLSMLRIQDALQNKTDPLTPAEQAAIRQHPADSARLLQEAGVHHAEWLAHVALHHDAPGAAGAAPGDVPQNTRILALADSYCACIVQRRYRRTLVPGIALRDVLTQGGRATEPLLAAYFIKEIGTYPPGAFVRLQNGEIAVATGKGPDPGHPAVHAFIGPRGAPLSFPIRRDTTKDLHGVREAIHPQQIKLQFSMHQLWGNEASL